MARERRNRCEASQKVGAGRSNAGRGGLISVEWWFDGCRIFGIGELFAYMCLSLSC